MMNLYTERYVQATELVFPGHCIKEWVGAEDYTFRLYLHTCSGYELGEIAYLPNCRCVTQLFIIVVLIFP